MTELIVKNGYGIVKIEGHEFVVLKMDGVYSLRHNHYWVKNNCKRLSTLQKFINERNYDIIIKEI